MKHTTHKTSTNNIQKVGPVLPQITTVFKCGINLDNTFVWQFWFWLGVLGLPSQIINNMFTQKSDATEKVLERQLQQSNCNF